MTERHMKTTQTADLAATRAPIHAPPAVTPPAVLVPPAVPTGKPRRGKRGG